LHEKKHNFSLNDGVVKKTFIFSLKISVLSRCKFRKTIQVIIKSLIHAIHAIAILNSNMHIKFQVNQIISMGVLQRRLQKT